MGAPHNGSWAKSQMVGGSQFWSLALWKMTQGSLSMDQQPWSSTRRLCCQDNCCQDRLVLFGKKFTVLFLYTKPSLVSTVRPRQALGVSRWKLRNSRKGKRLLPPRGSLQSYVDLHKVHGLSECACISQIRAPPPSVVSLFRPQYQKEFQSLRFSSATFSWEKMRSLGMFCILVHSYKSFYDLVQRLWSAPCVCWWKQQIPAPHPICENVFCRIIDMPSEEDSVPFEINCL